MVSVLVAAVLAAAPLKVALMPLDGGEGVNESTAKSLTQAVLAEVRKQQGVTVMSPDELSAIISLERQKQLMGCSDDSCVAEIAQALGVDRVLVGSVSKLGASWLCYLKLLEAKNGAIASQVDRRLKDKSIDDVLDAFPQMVSELFGGRGTVATVQPQQAPPPLPPVAPVAGKVTETGGKDEPFTFSSPALPKKAIFLTDGKGHFFATLPFEQESDDRLLFAGDAKKLYHQRVVSYSAEGTQKFGFTFWEPRVANGYQKAIDAKDLETKAPKFSLTCGEKEIPLTQLSKGEQAKLLSSAKFLKPRWRRAGHTLARDDNGTYYFVDSPREGKDPAEGLRLFIGPKGKTVELELNDVLADQKGLLLLSSQGKLRISPREEKAEWIPAQGASVPLTYLPLGYDEARLIYSQLGVYKNEVLGSACDAHL